MGAHHGPDDDKQHDGQLRQRFYKSLFGRVGHYNSENTPWMFADFTHGLTLKALPNSGCLPAIFRATCIAETITGVMPPPALDVFSMRTVSVGAADSQESTACSIGDGPYSCRAPERIGAGLACSAAG